MFVNLLMYLDLDLEMRVQQFWQCRPNPPCWMPDGLHLHSYTVEVVVASRASKIRAIGRTPNVEYDRSFTVL